MTKAVGRGLPWLTGSLLAFFVGLAPLAAEPVQESETAPQGEPAPGTEAPLARAAIPEPKAESTPTSEPPPAESSPGVEATPTAEPPQDTEPSSQVDSAFPSEDSASIQENVEDDPEARAIAAREWFVGTTHYGYRGLYRLQAGYGLHEGELVGTGLMGVSQARDVLSQDDLTIRRRHLLGIAWSPKNQYEVAIGYDVTIASNTGQGQLNLLRSLGGARLGVRRNHFITTRWAVSSELAVMFPNSLEGTKFAFHATSPEATAAVSYKATKWLDTALNMGYRYDRTQLAALDHRATLRAAGIAIADEHQLLFGVGFLTHTYNAPGDGILIQFLAEATSAIAFTKPFNDNPVVSTFGARIIPRHEPRIETSFGCDVRLLGAGSHDRYINGQPLWNAFLYLTLHLYKPAAEQTKLSPAN